MKNTKRTLVIGAVVIIPLTIAFVTLPKAYFISKPECNNVAGNSILNSKDVTSADYQNEVIRRLASKKPGDFKYFFKTFVQEGETTYMIINFRNDEQCFDARIKVDKWDKLAGMKRTNGVSYPKELYDLEWKIVETGIGRELMYVDMHRIID
jgi:hypothetical protein